MKAKRVGRPAKYTRAERLAKAAAYQRRWREANPLKYEAIWRRAYEKKKRVKQEGSGPVGVEVDLVL